MALNLGPKDRIPFGLYELVREAENMAAGPVTGENVVRVPLTEARHPFDLSWVSSGSVGQMHFDRWFLGHPGRTDDSVTSMIRLIGWNIAHNVIPTLSPKMRVILAECDLDDRSMHDAYFEIGIAGDLFLAGGCTDCSGEGSTGRDKLECVFELLAKIYGAEIERVGVPYNQAHEAECRIIHQIEAFARS